MQVLDRTAAYKIQQVRLVVDGENRVVRTQEALELARDQGLDLVIVSDKSDPPVCRIQDFNKVLYEKKKKEKGKQKTSEVKEVQLKLNIADHDFETKMTNVKRFLERGDKVKVFVRLKGRERERPERVRELLDRVAKSAGGKAMSGGPGVLMIEHS